MPSCWAATIAFPPRGPRVCLVYLRRRIIRIFGCRFRQPKSIMCGRTQLTLEYVVRVYRRCLLNAHFIYDVVRVYRRILFTTLCGFIDVVLFRDVVWVYRRCYLRRCAGLSTLFYFATLCGFIDVVYWTHILLTTLCGFIDVVLFRDVVRVYRRCLLNARYAFLLGGHYCVSPPAPAGMPCCTSADPPHYSHSHYSHSHQRV